MYFNLANNRNKAVQGCEQRATAEATFKRFQACK